MLSKAGTAQDFWAVRTTIPPGRTFLNFPKLRNTGVDYQILSKGVHSLPLFALVKRACSSAVRQSSVLRKECRISARMGVPCMSC